MMVPVNFESTEEVNENSSRDLNTPSEQFQDYIPEMFEKTTKQKNIQGMVCQIGRGIFWMKRVSLSYWQNNKVVFF